MKDELVKCKLCGAEMSSKSKTCPSCGAKNKKPFYKAAWFWVLIVVVIAIIASVAGGNDSEKTGGSAKNEAEKKTTYKIGETAELKGANVTVNKIKKSNGDEYEKPKDGCEFVIVEVKITNSSDSNISYNVLDFKMQNSQGNITDETFYTGNNNDSLSCGELAPGGTVTGTITFEQPKDDTGLILIYQGDFWSDDQIKFDLQ